MDGTAVVGVIDGVSVVVTVPMDGDRDGDRDGISDGFELAVPVPPTPPAVPVDGDIVVGVGVFVETAAPSGDDPSGN